jgi:hypothetical protein
MVKDSGFGTMTTALRAITEELNRRSQWHLIGRLQEFRKTAKGLKRLATRDIFNSQTTFKRYAFHVGGRRELQFNVGYEGDGEDRQFRQGVAFSFGRSHSLPDPRILLPKVRRFNKFLTTNPEAFSDMRMWIWTREGGERKRSKDLVPKKIEWNSRQFLQQSPFIFLGRLVPAGKINYETILSDLDRLLPLYEYVERGPNALKGGAQFDDIGGFSFEPRYVDKETATTATIVAKRVKVKLRENKLQKALRDHLANIYGSGNVSCEQSIRTMEGDLCKTDIMVRQGSSYWIYEAKIGPNARECIRRAIGQLLEYSFWPGNPGASKLIIVGEPPQSAQSAKYLSRLREKFALPIQYMQFDMSKRSLR